MRRVYKHRVRSLLSTFVFSFLPAVTGWQERTRTVSLAVVAFLWVYTFVSIYVSRRVSRTELDRRSAVFWSWVFYLQLALFALVLDGFFLYLDSQGVPGALTLLMFATAGFSAGSVAAYHYLRWGGPVFLWTAIIPQLVYLALRSGGSAVTLDVGMIIFSIFMTVVNMELHQHAMRTLSAGYEAEAAKEAAETLALTDTLTGLQNRRAFFDMVPHLLASAKRSNRPVSLLMLDLDHFKTINDCHGHAAGDTALKQVATMVQAVVRESDIAARLGGEEFAILLPDTPLDGGKQMAERIREKITDIDLSCEGVNFPLTASLGVAECSAVCDSVDKLLERADEALYLAKHNGRNRTEVFRMDHE